MQKFKDGEIVRDFAFPRTCCQMRNSMSVMRVDISVKKGIMIVTPAKRIRGRHSLKDLVAHIPESYQPGEVDWGEPVGKEVW